MKGESPVTIPVTTDELAAAAAAVDAIESADEMAKLRDEIAALRDLALQKAQKTKELKVSETAVYYISQALNLLGIECDAAHPSRERTPERFVSYLQEFINTVDIDKLMGDGFDAASADIHHTDVKGMITQTNIPFRAVCEHHLLPMLGYAHVGYVPHKKIVGISKLARLVEAIGTERPSLQESITERIADVLFDHLDSLGSIVVISATHGCMAVRGVTAPGVLTSTSCIRGVFRDVPEARQEFFNILQLAQGRPHS
jgi:GTP cyclohydrolase IA